jgi:hypothetical protein
MGILDQAREDDNDEPSLQRMSQHISTPIRTLSGQVMDARIAIGVPRDLWRAGSQHELDPPAGELTLIEVSGVTGPISPIVALNDVLPTAAFCSCFKHPRKPAARAIKYFVSTRRAATIVALDLAKPSGTVAC